MTLGFFFVDLLVEFHARGMKLIRDAVRGKNKNKAVGNEVR